MREQETEEERHLAQVNRLLDHPKLGQAARTLAAPARYYRYFNQGEHWVPNGKPPVLIAEMDLAWRYNCTRFLERNAARYAALFAEGCSAEEYVIAMLYPGAPEEIADQIQREAAWAKRDPLAWVRSTKLYRALATELPEKGAPLRKLASRARHWGGCEARLKPKKGTCTCATLAEAERVRKVERDRALAEAMMPE